MAALLNQLGIDKLSVSDRLTLIDQIWESLDAEDGTFDVPPPSEHELVIANTAADPGRMNCPGV
jgi:putative addiction module component (TIGR02574 family)